MVCRSRQGGTALITMGSSYHLHDVETLATRGNQGHVCEIEVNERCNFCEMIVREWSDNVHI